MFCCTSIPKVATTTTTTLTSSPTYNDTKKNNDICSSSKKSVFPQIIYQPLCIVLDQNIENDFQFIESKQKRTRKWLKRSNKFVVINSSNSSGPKQHNFLQTRELFIKSGDCMTLIFLSGSHETSMKLSLEPFCGTKQGDEYNQNYYSQCYTKEQIRNWKGKWIHTMKISPQLNIASNNIQNMDLSSTYNWKKHSLIVIMIDLRYVNISYTMNISFRVRADLILFNLPSIRKV